MKKSKKTTIAIIVIVCVLVGVITILANEVFGNPVSKILSKNAAEKYIEETYPGKNFVVKNAVYDFKNMEYMVKIESTEDDDIFFYVTTDGLGRNIDDNYSVYFDENGYYDYTGIAVDEYMQKVFSMLDEGRTEEAKVQMKYFAEFYIDIPEDKLAYSKNDIEWEETVTEVEIIGYRNNNMLFAVYYPPVGEAVSYLYKSDTKELIELQEDTDKTSGEWHIVDDMLIGGTQALSVDQNIDLYAYNWDGKLLYKRTGIMATYYISEDHIYYTELNEADGEYKYTIYKMNPDGTEQKEHYTATFKENVEFAIQKDKIVWWENGEEKSLDLLTI